LEIAARVVQPVRVIDAKPVNLALGRPLEHAPVRRLEHGLVLRAQAREVVDVEKAPAVDLVGRDAPVREPIRLTLEQGGPARVALALAGCAVERRDVALYVFRV